MRKKYLSALLFGALLFASAGTFTSCKDYDDDIDNLQSQIDKVVSDLASLKSTVDNLKVGVTSVTVQDDQLVVVTDGATTKMNLPVGVQVSEIEIKDGHLYVGGVDKGAIAGETEKAQKVEVKEDGFLYIDDVKQDGLHVGTDVVIKDASNGVYTITIGKETITLPMVASKMIVSVIGKANGLQNYDNEAAIQWNYAANKIDWAGPKGTIAKGALMVGKTPTANILVTPASVDLSASTLTLINSKGETAPVKVSAVAANAYTAPRDASATWTISITPDATAISDKMATAFTTGGDDPKNYIYALAVDGTVVSGYEFIIDTAAKNLSMNSNGTYNASSTGGTIALDRLQLKGETTATTIDLMSTNTAKLGTYTFTLANDGANTNLLNVYDAYIELTNKDDADRKGVSANGLTITSDAALAGGQTVAAKLHIMSISGNEYTKEFNITFQGSTTAEEAIGTQSFKIMPNSELIKINLGDAFTGLTAAQAEAINANVSWKTDKKFLVENLATSQIKYYSDESCANDKQVVLTASTIRNIKYATIKLMNSTAFDQLIADAAAGTSKITITMTDGVNEVKKVTTDLEVILPTFDELFPKTNKWSDGAFNVTLTSVDIIDSSSNTTHNPAVNFTQAFTGQSGALTSKITYDIDKVNDVDVKLSQSNGIVALKKIQNDNKELAVKTIQATASYKIAGKDGLTVKSEKFTTNLKSIFEGVALKFIVDDVAQDVAVVNANNLIPAYYKASTTDAKGNGLAVVRGTGEGSITALITGKTVDGLKLTWNNGSNSLSSVSDVFFSTPKVEGLSLTPGWSGNDIKLDGINNGDAGQLVVTFTDYTGIVTKLKIDFKKN